MEEKKGVCLSAGAGHGAGPRLISQLCPPSPPTGFSQPCAGMRTWGLADWLGRKALIARRRQGVPATRLAGFRLSESFLLTLLRSPAQGTSVVRVTPLEFQGRPLSKAPTPGQGAHTVLRRHGDRRRTRL